MNQLLKLKHLKTNFNNKTGEKIIDGISSWWVNTLGHKTRLSQKLFKRSRKTTPDNFCRFTHKPALNVAERLSKFLPENFTHIFFSDSGSTSVEVALKWL